MPQNPLDLLKNIALRNVPKTQQESENQTLRAQAIQDAEPDGWKKSLRKGFDAIGDFSKGFLVDDPAFEGFEGKSNSRIIGGLANTLPLVGAMGSLKKVGGKLPIIAPEAYDHVKAGGLRLYSRLTDTFAKAPKTMKPAKAMSLAKSGASKDEIALRKLEDFFRGRQPMEDVPREEIMNHLAANPLELEVARKGDFKRPNPAIDDYNKFIHDMDTKYGPNWGHPNISGRQQGANVISPEEVDLYHQLDFASRDQFANDIDSTQYSFLQTPGPSENYGESLVKVPVKEPLQTESGRPILQDGYAKHPDTFTSSHFTDDPNTLVWSRHNDRNINNLGYDEEYGKIPIGPNAAPGKGRFIEEIQSDWHQQGNKYGYRTPETLAIYDDLQDQSRGINEAWRGTRLHHDPELWDKIGRQVRRQQPGMAGSRHDALTEIENHGIQPGGETFTPDELDAINEYLDFRRQEKALMEQRRDLDPASLVPDAPFKDTYHELALKQQLLDAANDPSLEWLGVADAHTNAAMEGHLNYGDAPREGTQLWYDQKHPNALKKLLEPLGGNVGYDQLPGKRPYAIEPGQPDDTGAIVRALDEPQGRWEHVASPIAKSDEGPIGQSWSDARTIAHQMKQRGNMLPGPGMWKASLTPELKELIKTRGFPAMVALMGLRTAIEPNKPE